MINFLKETKDAIKLSGHNENDVIFIGSEKSGHQCTWDEFCKIADFEYDNGYGAQMVAKDLIFVFKDGQKMWRSEYDGSEWWEYSTKFNKCEESHPIIRLSANSYEVGWVNLDDINEKIVHI